MNKLSLINNVVQADKTARFQSHMVLENIVSLANHIDTTPDVLVESVEHVLAHITAHAEQHIPVDALSQQSLAFFLAGLDTIVSKFDKVSPESRTKMSHILLACRFDGDRVNQACNTIIKFGADHGSNTGTYNGIVSQYYADPSDELASEALVKASRQLRAKMMSILATAVQ